MASAVYTDISRQCVGNTAECMGQTQNAARHDDAQLAAGPGVQAVTHRCEHHSLKVRERGEGLVKSMLSPHATQPVRSHRAGLHVVVRYPA